MMFENVQMENGSILDGERIGELVNFIIDKFSEEKMNHDEAQIVLNKTKSIIGEYSKIQKKD